MSQICRKCGHVKSHPFHVPRGSLGRGMSSHTFKSRRDMMEGTVLRLVGDKGFGFVRGEDGKDYFFHRSDFHGFFEDLLTDVRGGRNIKVNFHSVPSDKGLRAGEVMRIDGGT